MTGTTGPKGAMGAMGAMGATPAAPAPEPCGHFEARGLVLAELGEPDQHVEDCADCKKLRERHRTLALALAAIGDERQAPAGWQAQVWARIEREEAAARQRRSLRLAAAGTAVAIAAALVLYVRTGVPADSAPSIEIVAGATAMRSTSARVGDRIRVRVGDGMAVWLYRDDRSLIARCDAGMPPGLAPGPRCAAGKDGLALESELAAPGRYQVVVLPRTAPPPSGNLDRDVAAAASQGLAFRLTEVDVW
jgi:hypothetical protein